MSVIGRLKSAIESKDNRKVSELLEKMDVDDVNREENGETALSVACRALNNEALDLLLSKNGIDVNVKDKNLLTPLHIACGHNNDYAVERILATREVDVNAKADSGFTPLHVACGRNNDNAVRRILASPEVDVNAKSDTGFTPLHFACNSNLHLVVFRLLASPDICVNVKDKWGITPIEYSAGRCHEEALKLMLVDPRVGLDEDGRRLDGQVGRVDMDGIGRKEKENCLEMINNERKKRERLVKQEQPSQAGNIGISIEKIEKCNKDIGAKEKRRQEDLDDRNQKRKDLNERQSLEFKRLAKQNEEEEMILAKKQEEEVVFFKKRKEEEVMLSKKHKEKDTILFKKHKEKETILLNKHKEAVTMLENTFAREDQVEQRHIAILKECQDELAKYLQKVTNSPGRDASSKDHNKLEAAKRSLECPICLELMLPPTRIWMFRFTHIICQLCKDRLNGGKCPTCTSERVNQRAFMAEDFARTIFN